MKILIAEDDPISSKMLEATLKKWGHSVISTTNGEDALEVLKKRNAPQLAIVDWMMPKLDGVDFCRRVRKKKRKRYTYIILLTTKGEKEDIAVGLRAGADDYIKKPFSPKELQARIDVGIRILSLQNKLADHVKRLKEALSNVKQLQGLLPICSYCKKIRNDENYWQQVEKYISEHADVKFSHGICPDCYNKLFADEFGSFGELVKETKLNEVSH